MHLDLQKKMDGEYDDKVEAQVSEFWTQVNTMKKMLRYKKMLTHPNYSDNIFMELSISNLRKFYKKSKKELEDIRLFFNMGSEQQEKAIIEGAKVKKRTSKVITF